MSANEKIMNIHMNCKITWIKQKYTRNKTNKNAINTINNKIISLNVHNLIIIILVFTNSSVAVTNLI